MGYIPSEEIFNNWNTTCSTTHLTTFIQAIAEFHGFLILSHDGWEKKPAKITPRCTMEILFYQS